MAQFSGRTLVVWNSQAGGARTEAAQVVLNAFRLYELATIVEADERSLSAALREIGDSLDNVVVAGGDGTLHHVLNMLGPRLDRIRLAVLPIGTGNDFCRSLGMPLDPVAAYEAIAAGDVRRIDLAEVESPDSRRLFINVANGGNSNRVSECMTDEMKSRWGAWCYLRGAIDVLTDLQGFETTLLLDDGPAETYAAWNVIVANGRTAAGGAEVAPQADLEDGLLDTIIVLDQPSPYDLAALMAEFFLGNYLNDERVVFRRARSVELRMSPESNFMVDGEVVGGQPLRFRVLPGALQVYVGPEYARPVDPE